MPGVKAKNPSGRPDPPSRPGMIRFGGKGEET